jgi:quercetin 2,3-dioxygenase
MRIALPRGGGFPTQGHRDMEIITYVLDGLLGHRDSLGNGVVIGPGDVKRMSAGRGVRHSEFNHAPTEPLHFIQIGASPEPRGD